MEREEIEERNQDIAERFVRGQTYQQIGDKWGLTRERVRQILTKMGYKWYQGGAHVTAKERERREQNEKERSCRRRTGLSIRDKKRLAGKSGDPESPYRKFLDQRRNANERGIEWNLTFAAWWYLWCLYDCYDSRGRHRGRVRDG